MLIWDSRHERLIEVPDRNPVATEFLMVGRYLRMMMQQASEVTGQIIDMPKHWGWPKATTGDDRGHS